MASKKLLGFWAFFDFCLLAAAVISILFSILWRMSGNPLRHLVITNGYLTAGLAIGVMFVFTFIMSIGAIVQPNHVTLPLAILNWVILGDATAVVVVGTMIWWMTLQERDNFDVAFSKTDLTVREAIQEKLQCCGYWFNNESSIIVDQGFCATAFNATPCVGPITAFADSTLNDIFTTVYGFAAVLGCLFLATLCVIKTRHETERFRRIDAKRGGRGFV